MIFVTADESRKNYEIEPNNYERMLRNEVIN